MERRTWPTITDLQSQLQVFRGAYPSGTALFNLVAVREQPRVATSWTRLTAVFLSAPGAREHGPIHLGTAHLFQATGLRAVATRSLFDVLAARSRDFKEQGNAVSRSVDDAADWLFARLSHGSVVWSRSELRGAIEEFCDKVSTGVGPDEARSIPSQ